MMRQTLLTFFLFCFCLTAGAQLDKEAARAYVDDVRAYERAVRHIVRDGEEREGVAALTELIAKREQTSGYSLMMLASFYSARQQGWVRLKDYQRAVEDGRLSLALGAGGDKGRDAVVYGGLAYDASSSEIQPDGTRRTRGAMSGLAPLPGTKTEAEAIAKTINATTDMHADLRLGKDGTEASFKCLDGQHKQIVHIATHGFYNREVAGTSNSLSRCGLYFAGADYGLQGETIPTGTDDGILTAQEIASLDLHGLHLVTLSACQTGDGEITSDGVFGLQRGFKKAGAQGILMSLWPVDDAATCLLMTSFYRNWIGQGKTRLEALEMAKQTVRSRKEKGWDAPKYWAAFILLDGLGR